MSIHQRPLDEQRAFWLYKARQAAEEAVEALQELRRLPGEPSAALERAFDHAGDAYDAVVRLGKGAPARELPASAPSAVLTMAQARELIGILQKGWAHHVGKGTVRVHRSLQAKGLVTLGERDGFEAALITEAGRAALAKWQAKRGSRTPGSHYEGWRRVIQNL